METYKDIKGYEGLYQVSNLGNVKSLRRNIIKKPSINSRGYISINLSVNKVIKSMTIHRLVALHFISNPENKREVNHKNGIKTDNKVENLEWTTSSENVQHGYDSGLIIRFGKKGADNPRSRPIFQLTLSGEFVAKFASAKEAARILGAYQGNISQCCNGKIKTAFGFKWQYAS